MTGDALVLSISERRSIEAQARMVRLAAAKLERHVLQNLTDVQAAYYIAEMRKWIDTMEERMKRGAR